jgi:peptidoglycan/xylan/chitin deacetylase (PgdA/CDA1 family)
MKDKEELLNQSPPSLHFLYHELRTESSKYSYVVQTSEFERHADLFARRQQSEDAGTFPEITFDDGHISNYDIALPILQARDLVAHFFITVGWTGKRPSYMDWQQVRILHEAGQKIGAHGWSHALLTHCDQSELQVELKTARLVLEEKLGTSITTMSLPGGRYNNRVLSACREAGYTRIYTSVPQIEVDPLGYAVGRLNILKEMRTDWIESLLLPRSAALASHERQYRLKLAAKNLLGDRIYEKLWSVLNRKESETHDYESVGK